MLASIKVVVIMASEVILHRLIPVDEKVVLSQEDQLGGANQVPERLFQGFSLKSKRWRSLETPKEKLAI